MDEQQEQEQTVELYTQEQKEQIIGYLLDGNDPSDLAEQLLERLTAEEIKYILSHLAGEDE